MTPFYVITTAMTLVLLTSQPSEAWKRDIKVKYYSTTTLTCTENGTALPAFSTVFWITPDAVVVKSDDPAEDWPEHVIKVNDSAINVTDVDDDLFGYYTCVMTSQNDVTIARWGLNVDGADFSDLEEEYRKQAVIGAIAAAVMVVIVGGACAIWHFRYSKRMRRDEGRGVEEDDLQKPDKVYTNAAYDTSPADLEVEAAEVAGDRSPAAAAEGHENGGVDNFKM